MEILASLGSAANGWGEAEGDRRSPSAGVEEGAGEPGGGEEARHRGQGKPRSRE
jgi:hypothetical protein